MSAVAQLLAEVVRLDGADALGYLDAQCTQDLSGLEGDRTATTFVLEPTGELVTVATAQRTDEGGVVLEVPAGTGERTATRLRRFAIRADVTVRDPVASVGSGALRSELERIDAGVPGPIELARGIVPHGVSAALVERCVSFTKGCYPGQELVARMQARGATPPYVLRGIVADAPIHVGDAVGAERFDGAITSVAEDPASGGWHALCVLHRTDADTPTIEVRAESGTVVARFH
jgi:tRNA-modifying protein YgfZ